MSGPNNASAHRIHRPWHRRPGVPAIGPASELEQDRIIAVLETYSRFGPQQVAAELNRRYGAEVELGAIQWAIDALEAQELTLEQREDAICRTRQRDEEG
jgi:hypothetical protein